MEISFSLLTPDPYCIYSVDQLKIINVSLSDQGDSVPANTNKSKTKRNVIKIHHSQQITVDEFANKNNTALLIN